MSYELRLDQSLGRNLRRIFRQEIATALALAQGETKPRDTVVHEIRKHLKKARAVLQLVRKRIGSKSFRRYDRCLRDVGRLMTEIRDAEVRWQTMRQLEDLTHHHYRSYQKIEKLLDFELQNFAAAFEGWEKKAVRLLTWMNKEARDWPSSGCHERHLRRAMQRCYKSGQKALAKARKDGGNANIHELRKQVKLLGYQVRILRSWNPIVVGDVLRELTQLGHLLGRVHDLTFLADRLRIEQPEPHWGKKDDELLAIVEKSESELRCDGIELAQRFFAERHREFGGHIDEWFEAAHHVSGGSVTESLLTCQEMPTVSQAALRAY